MSFLSLDEFSVSQLSVHLQVSGNQGDGFPSCGGCWQRLHGPRRLWEPARFLSFSRAQQGASPRCWDALSSRRRRLPPPWLCLLCSSAPVAPGRRPDWLVVFGAGVADPGRCHLVPAPVRLRHAKRWNRDPEARTSLDAPAARRFRWE